MRIQLNDTIKFQVSNISHEGEVVSINEVGSGQIEVMTEYAVVIFHTAFDTLLTVNGETEEEKNERIKAEKKAKKDNMISMKKVKDQFNDHIGWTFDGLPEGLMIVSRSECFGASQDLYIEEIAADGKTIERFPQGTLRDIRHKTERGLRILDFIKTLS